MREWHEGMFNRLIDKELTSLALSLCPWSRRDLEADVDKPFLS
jgi:hypothetical protein